MVTLQRRPLAEFREKLKAHGIGGDAPNRHMIPLIHAKCFLSALPRWLDQRQLKPEPPAADPEKRPVFILGHWRSGTTFLQFLLNKDPAFFTQNKYQSLFPDGFYTTEQSLKPVLAWLLSLTRPVHEWQANISKSMAIDTPSEAELALISQLVPYTYHWAHFFPRSWQYYFRHYLLLEGLREDTYRKWQQAYGTFLNKLYQYHSSGRLLVKNPGDTARISALLGLYPHARFIFLHRHPYEVYYSNHRLWNNVQRSISLEQITQAEQQRLILTMYQWLHQAYQQQKSQLASDQLIEVAYEDLIAQPEAVLAAIYQQLNLKGFDQALPYFRSYIQENLNWPRQRYPYHPGDLALINHHWAFAFEEWGYRQQERA